MISEIRAAWTARQLSTEPIDRPAAQSALHDLYIAARLQGPLYFFWFDSPILAAVAVLLLAAPHCPQRGNLLKSLARGKHWKERMEQARNLLCEQSGVEWQRLCKEVGNVLLQHRSDDCQNVVPLAAILQAARIHFYSRPNPPEDRDYGDDELARLVTTQQTWAYRLDHTFTTTWLCPFDGEYTVLKMVLDEEKALESAAPAVLPAAWKALRLIGDFWWPMRRGAVLTERPVEIHRNGEQRLHRVDGPAIVYRDGFGRWAFQGVPMPEKWIRHPEDMTPGELRECSPDFRKYARDRMRKLPPRPKLNPSAILNAALPAESAARVELLRAHNQGRLPFFDRYLAGDHQKVWEELVALGSSVREEPHAADALAVAYEMAGRVAANVRAVTTRLGGLGYKFASRNPHVPPGAKTAAQVARLDKTTGGLPLSLRAFYEVVGSVDWIGRHPTMAPPKASISPDPLVVYPAGDALKEWLDEKAGGGEPELVIAPDALHKAGHSGGGAYTIETPNLRADGPLLSDAHQRLFVDYLRLVFRFGGFPGYEDADVPPLELASLRAGLVEF
jgi:hypothetical protein